MSSTDSYYVGVDWCSGEWLAVAYTATEYDHADVYDEVGAIWHRYEETGERIAIDIPIGLQEGGTDPRPPDRLARQVLGRRASSVFTPPVREAAHKQTYQAAKRVNERKADRGLSTQAYAVAEGIAALDDLLQAIDDAREVFVEAHPEVCFRAFAGEPLRYSKRLAAGYAERMRVLANYDPDVPPAVQAAATATGSHEVTIDDVLDAMAVALTVRPGSDPLRSLPPEPPTDAAGLPMRMVYRAADPLIES